MGERFRKRNKNVEKNWSILLMLTNTFLIQNRNDKRKEEADELPYILESNPHPNPIRTNFCRFLKKKKLVRGFNPHLWEEEGEDKDDSDWVTENDSVMSDDGESDE